MDSSRELGNRAYKALTTYFIQHQDERIEIEILPPAIQPPDGILMEEGVNLGVPKKILALAFIAARELFFAGVKADGVASQPAFEASNVMLLFDPEHITAANFRKRRLIGIRKRETENAKDEFAHAVDREFAFLDSILTSPLHRQSKSPTLWYHRTWLLGFSFPINLADCSGEQFLQLISAEVDAVCKAGERHPKNYYAWQYARRLFVKIGDLYEDETEHAWKTSYYAFMSEWARLVKDWCRKHPGDISGWSFLLFLLPRIDSVPLREEIVEQVLDYAIKLKWKQEALWVFIRSVLAQSMMRDGRTAVLQRLYSHREERINALGVTGAADHYENNALTAVKWIEKYSTAPV